MVEEVEDPYLQVVAVVVTVVLNILIICPAVQQEVEEDWGTEQYSACQCWIYEEVVWEVLILVWL